MFNPSQTNTQYDLPQSVTPSVGDLRRIWMRRQKPPVTLTRLAKLSGVSAPRMLAVLHQEAASEHHIAAMRAVGMPEDLLPSLPGHSASGAE